MHIGNLCLVEARGNVPRETWMVLKKSTEVEKPCDLMLSCDDFFTDSSDHRSWGSSWGTARKRKEGGREEGLPKTSN